jgi:DNA primase
MNSNIRQYLIEHCIDPDNLPNNIRVHDVQNKIEIRITDQDSFLLFSKYRMFDDDMKYKYDKGSKMALFNSKSLKQDGDVYIVEGEFDAIALNKLHPVVISSTGGCSSWKSEWTELLKDRDVKICFDNDDPGKKASMSLYKKLVHNVKSIEVLSFADHNDVCEHIYKTGSFTPITVIEKEFSLMFLETITKKAQINRIQSYIENNIFDEFYRNELLDIIIDMYRKKYAPKKVQDNKEYSDLESIRKIPITNYIDFKGGVACCIFHSERNPSMYYNDFNSPYPNTVKCYSCGKFGDVIDVVMETQNVDFKNAIQLLKNN